ncbi:MAG: ScyD/ScyE family protein [Marmoricola sp.]
MKRTTTSAAVLTTALVVAATTTAAPAPAADSGGSSGNRVLATGVGAPFQIATRGKTVFYTDGFAGTINKVTNRGPRVVARVNGVSGIEFTNSGKTMAIAHGGGGPTPPARVTLVTRGKAPVVAKVDQYENTVNPDKNRTYGITTGASPACKTELETPQPDSPPPPPATYKGIKDSHPYQLEALRGGAFALADAGVNGILRIGKRGGISLIALLPPQPIRLSTAQAQALGVPSCANETYAFEPVPTDVERAGGALWVTTLPGGPESPALGARGSVYKIKRGVVTKVAGGFLGATNLDVVRGRIYVTEFFSGKVTKLGKGGRFTRYNIPGAVSVEATRKHLYIGSFGSGPSAPGKVVRLPR